MKRYNLFNQVHKGLKALLFETALCLQQTDFSNTDEAEAALAQLETVITLFEKHALTEDTIEFAAIQRNEPALIHAFEQEHEEDLVLEQRLNGIITAFHHAVSSQDKTIIGVSINQAFIDFMVFNLKHMSMEECMINPALWKHYSDTELHCITQQIVEGLSQQIMEQYNKWMIRGLNNIEIINWLKDVKNNAPDIIFQSLLQLAEQELSKQRLQLILEALIEGAMVA
jgi:hypothetical protein